MARVLDYAWGRPSIASMKAAGAVAVSRYLSYGSSGKVLTRAEADGLRGAGIDVVSNWEWYGDWVHDYSGGFARGVLHAAEAARQHVACGGPPSRPIYFSTDFSPASLARTAAAGGDGVRLHELTRMHPDHPAWDALTELDRDVATATIEANTSPRAGQLATIADYYRGVASVIGLARTGAYGGYATIKYLFDAGVIRWGWQTYAWSAGQWDPRAQVRQIHNGVLVGGVDCDLDESMVADFGQWGAAADVVVGGTMQEFERTSTMADRWGAGAVRMLDTVDILFRDGTSQPVANILKTTLAGQSASLAAIAADVAGVKAALVVAQTAVTALAQAITAGGGNVDTVAILARIDSAGAAESAVVAALQAQITELTAKLGRAARAGADELAP